MANFCAPPGVPLGDKTGYFHEGGAGGPDSIGRMQMAVGETKEVALAFYLWSGREVWVRSRNDGIARIVNSAVFNQDEKVYSIKACDRPDHTYLEAGQGERPWFTLEVQVTEKGGAMPSSDPRLTVGLVVSGPIATVFTEGFAEGLRKAKRANTDIVVNRIKGNPVNFYTGYIDGIAVGLWDGLVDLIKGLASLVELGSKYAPYMAAATNPIGVAALAGWAAYKWNFDPKFKEEMKQNAEWAKAVGDAASAVVTELKKNPKDTVEKYLGATKDAGVQAGSALADELDAKVPTASAFDFGYWAGWIIGRALFEIIFMIITEGIGDALKGASMAGKATEGMKAAGETATVVAKVRARLQGILNRLPALKAFVETLTKTKSAATAAEVAAKAKAIAEALEAAQRAKRAMEAADAVAKAGGAVDAAEAAAKAREAVEAYEAASKAGTAAEAQQATAKAKAAADAAEAAAAKARAAADAAAKAAKLLEDYVNLNPRATEGEKGLGRWLDQMAQRGELGEIKRVRGMPELNKVTKPGVSPGGNPDFHLFTKNRTNAELQNINLAPDIRCDAVVTGGTRNTIDNAIDKGSRQAQVLFVELTETRLTDAEIKAWEAHHAATKHQTLQRMIVIRNTGGARTIVHDLRVR